MRSKPLTMRPVIFSLFKYLMILILLFSLTTGYGQNKIDVIDNPTFENLEKAIGQKQLLVPVKQQLETWEQKAIRSKDDITLARCLSDLMKIQDLRTEDSLYFKNSAFMDTLLNDEGTSTGLKAIIHIMHAQRLSDFSYHPRRFNIATYRTKSLQHNYADLTSQQRGSIAIKDLDAAIKDHPFKGNVAKLLWLSSNPGVFLFEPKFEDIVLSEQVNFAVNRYDEYDPEKSKISGWASVSSDRFRQLLDSVAKRDDGKNAALRGYQKWLSFNGSDKAVAMFIESLARKYIFLTTQQDSSSREAYNNYLLANTNSPYTAFSAHTVYQLCLIWNEEGNRYVDFYNRYQFLTGNNFYKKYQYQPIKALQLYNQHAALMSKYPLFDGVLGIMSGQILRSGMRVEMEDKFIPGEQIPVKAIYKNTNTLFYRIVRITPEELIRNNYQTKGLPLLKRAALHEDSFKLPLPEDHNNHAVYLKLAPLDKGYYCLIFSNKNLNTDSAFINSIPFQVTGIAAINTDERVYVLDRKTGQPLTGATIQAFKKGVSVTAGFPARIKPEGYLMVPESKADSIGIVYKGDTLGYTVNLHSNSLPDDIYDKDAYDSKDDFYDDKLTMHIFTDRAIYRPGQTVHYKVILLTKDPYTGTPVLFNKETLGSGFFKNKLNKWIKNNHALITLNDPFGHKTDSAKMMINDFGSFAGSFTLSKTAATGDWGIDGDPDINDRNRGEFKVEEYKRPTLELSMAKQTKMLSPGQPFVIKLKLRSFSGANLNNIPISYSLKRNGDLPDKNKGASQTYNYTDEKLMDTTVQTDKNGELLIPVNDTLLSKYNLDDKKVFYYNYNLHANAVDATGESSEIDERLNVSNRPVKISIGVDKIYNRQAIPPLSVTTTADFEGTVGRQVSVKLYKVTDPDSLGFVKREVDQWYYPTTDWNTWFPQLAERDDRTEKKHALVLDTIINTGLYQKLILPKGKTGAGFYEIEAVCEDGSKIVGEYKGNFSVFDSASSEIPANDLDYTPVNSVKAGETVTWYSSSKNDHYTIYQVLFEANGKHREIKNIYQEVDEKKGITRWTYRIPQDAIGTVLLTRISVLNNKVLKHETRIFLVKTASEPPEIIVEKYRKVMAPGAQETFTVSIKTKNENIAAELMTTMYDASLDKLQKHEWSLPYSQGERLYLRTDWNGAITSQGSAGDYGQSEAQYLNLNGTPGSSSSLVMRELQGRAAGLSITDASGLQEVVVVGYGTVKKELLFSKTRITLRGNTSIKDYKQPLIVLDGVIYKGDLSELSPASITEAMVLKGADASAIYGSSAAQGVLIISTKGPIVLPGAEDPVVKIRKNFNETAFFFPQVHASPDGYYHFSFTMPETATEWEWKMLAQTRNAQFAYLDKKVQTQLNLMVQPNMLRLLYQGDQVKLQSRISNLDTTGINGKITCKIEDAVTGQDITASIVSNSTQNFKLERKSSGSIPFIITVPGGQTNPLKIVISAASATATDAEEHIIPVLNSKVFIRQSVAVHFNSNATISIPPVKLPEGASFYGIGLSINQKPQASLINALPWLANYSYDCAEQTFNKLRARAVALQLMQKDTAARSAFKKAALSIEKDKPKDGALPDELAEEAMPWLNIGNQAAYQQKQLFHLLDTINTKNDIAKRLERLYKLQQADGGLAWFDGGKSDSYISAYVLAGFGQLNNSWVADQHNATRQKELISRLYKYTEEQVLKQQDKYPDMYQVYALSYLRHLQDESAAIPAKVNTLLDAGWKNAGQSSLAEQALLIINTFRYIKTNDALYLKAVQQLENIRQLAINDAVNGLRWKDIADAEELGTSAEETLALLAEAFDLSGKYKDVNPGVIKWLLTTKQDQHWQTTKATAAAIDLLQKQSGSIIGETEAFTADIAGQHLSVSNGSLDGVPATFVALKQAPAAISLKQQGKDANGAVTWYYFAEPGKLDTLNKAIRVKKQFYVSGKDNGFVELTPGTSLKTGDKVHVKLTIETEARLKFVHISDPRAAAFEPGDNESGYRYGEGLNYYQSIKDTGLELFAESISRGISTIEYDMVVAMSGRFISGPVKLQCMYQPSATAYSNVQSILTTEK